MVTANTAQFNINVLRSIHTPALWSFNCLLFDGLTSPQDKGLLTQYQYTGFSITGPHHISSHSVRPDESFRWEHCPHFGWPQLPQFGLVIVESVVFGLLQFLLHFVNVLWAHCAFGTRNATYALPFIRSSRLQVAVQGQILRKQVKEGWDSLRAALKYVHVIHSATCGA